MWADFIIICIYDKIKIDYKKIYLQKMTDLFLDKKLKDGSIIKTIDDYERTKEQKLFRRVISKLSGAYSILNIYNNWIENMLPKQIKAQSFSQNGYNIEFNLNRIEIPKVHIGDKHFDLTPSYCRVNNKFYSANIYVNIKITLPDGNEVRNQEVNIGEIPIMLGSNICYLKGKNIEELVELGECISDPFGYFIIKGEKSIVTQNKGRESIPIIFQRKGIQQLTFTVHTDTKSQMITIKLGKKWNHIKINDFSSSNRKFLPIFVVYKIILGIEPEEAINDYILKYIKKEYHHKVRTFLHESIIKTKNISNVYEYVLKKRGETVLKSDLEFQNQKTNIRNVFINNLFKNMSTSETFLLNINYENPEELKYWVPSSNNNNKKYKGKTFEELSKIPSYVAYAKKNLKVTDKFIKYINFIEGNQNTSESVISNIYNKTKDNELEINLKINQYSYMIAKFCLNLVGVIPDDDRDSWYLKRFDSAGISISTLFVGILQNIMNNTKKKTVNYDHFIANYSSKCGSTIKKEFIRSFNNLWGISKSNNKENISVTTSRDTPLDLWSQTSKTSIDTCLTGKNTEIRELNTSQRCRHCIAETPEGQQVGIVTHDCVTSIFSVERDKKELYEFLKNIVTNEKKYFKKYNIDTSESENNLFFFINGILISFDNKNQYMCSMSMYKLLKKMKIYGELYYDIEITIDKVIDSVYIYSDSSRPICPFFRVENDELVIDKINGWDLDYDILIKNGCIEFLSPKEENDEDVVICYSIDKFRNYSKNLKKLYKTDKKKYYEYKSVTNYNYCNLDPLQIYGVAAGVAPMSNRQPCPRTTYQASMGKQALGEYHTNYQLKLSGATGKSGFKRLYRATRSFTETDLYFLPKMDIMPSGQTLNVAFYCDPDNQEDAVILSEDFVNSGMLNYWKYYTKTFLITNPEEILQRPPLINDKESPDKYNHINPETGLPYLNSYIKQGDCLVGKVTKNGRNTSFIAGLGEEGYVDCVYKNTEIDNNPVIKIKLRQKRKYVAGDKLALRYSQKGTVGRVEKRENMIRVSDGKNKGIVPDLYFNSHGLPSRGTIGLPIELLITKAAVYSGKRVDVSAFREIDISYAKKVLRENGFDENGFENMELPDGTPLKKKIYMGPLYDQALRHHVKDKIQARDRQGSSDFLTRQPGGGRVNRGGQKVGEMEKDSFVAHGASNFIIERMMHVSDEFKVMVCKNCGFMSNSHKICDICKKSKIGYVVIPYSFKLLLNLLYGIGVDTRLMTKSIK